MGISTVLDTQVLATSGADGDVLTRQADGTYLAETPSAGGSPGGSTGQIQYNNAGAFGGTVALVYAASGTHFTVTAQAATDVPVVVKAAASQTGNLIEVNSSSGSGGDLFRVEDDGQVQSTAGKFYRSSATVFALGKTTGSNDLSWVCYTNRQDATLIKPLVWYTSDSYFKTKVGVGLGNDGGAVEALGAQLHAKTLTASVPAMIAEAAASQTGNIHEWHDSASVVHGTVSENGYFTTRKVAAPADAELSASEVAYWFDDTNGAGKLMIKGKTANGTVVTGEVALS